MKEDARRYLDEIERRKRRSAGAIPYCPHEPHPKQREFLSLDCLEAMYGGGAGGGKSDALLMAALQHVDVPGYAALLLRRTYQDLALPEAIMSRAQEWLIPQGIAWDGEVKRFTFPSGATISFGYLDSEKDRFRYQSSAFQFIGFDELTQFPERWYRYLFSRLRKLEGSKVPLRMRSATNPGGIGHKWVKRRFLDKPEHRRFIPALLADNPSLDAAEYRKSLAELDEATRKQLEDGVWIQDTSILVYKFDPERNVVAELGLPKFDHYLLILDFGYVDSTAFAIIAWKEGDPRVYVLRSWKEAGLIPSSVAEIVKALTATMPFDQIIGDVGGLGKGYAEEMRQRFEIPVVPAEKQNKRGYISLVNGALERGELLLVEGHTEPLSAELEELPWNEDRSAPAEGFEDHCADTMLYGWRAAKAFVDSGGAESEPAEDEGVRMEREAMERWKAQREAAAEGADWILRRFGGRL